MGPREGPGEAAHRGVAQAVGRLGLRAAGDAAGLRVGYANGVEEVLVAQPNGVYALPDGGEAIAFQREEDTGRWLLRLYPDEARALTARRKEE